MFHLAINTVALGVGTDLDVPALTDDVLSQQNSHFVLAQPLGLMGVMACSALLDRIKLVSPSMRQLATPYIRPINQATVGITNPNIALWNDHPYALNPFEELAVQATSTIGASTERFTMGSWLQYGINPIPSGGWTALRYTSTNAAVANVWTTLALTFADTIPSGVYAMLLSEHFSTNAQYHRWIVSNQVPRPGYPSFANAASRHPYAIAKGQFGLMGVFRSNDLPRLQVLCNGTDATHTGYLHVTRIGSL